MVADKEASIAYAKHTVTVGKPTTPPPPPIDPPPADPPPTPGKWADLIGVSKAAADAVSDSPTRQELKTAVSNRLDDISEKCRASQCPTIQAAQQQISATIDSVLLSRPNRFSNWAAWRKSISDVLRAKGVTDLQDYLASVKAFLAGL